MNEHDTENENCHYGHQIPHPGGSGFNTMVTACTCKPVDVEQILDQLAEEICQETLCDVEHLFNTQAAEIKRLRDAIENAYYHLRHRQNAEWAESTLKAALKEKDNETI